jgi:hypothetical protein
VVIAGCEDCSILYFGESTLRHRLEEQFLRRWNHSCKRKEHASRFVHFKLIILTN